MEFLKDLNLENDTKFKIEISQNLMETFYCENYTDETNVILIF